MCWSGFTKHLLEVIEPAVLLFHCICIKAKMFFNFGFVGTCTIQLAKFGDSELDRRLSEILALCALFL